MGAAEQTSGRGVRCSGRRGLLVSAHDRSFDRNDLVVADLNRVAS
jgi:hypothetical protein